MCKLTFDIIKKKNKITINELSYKEGKDYITINGLTLIENKLSSFEKVIINTPTNDFLIQSGKKILVRGNKFDATNLPKFLSKQKGSYIFKKINSEIDIDFKSIIAPLSEELQNFKLIGEIKNGQFVKISSKGDFGGNNFLDISMRETKQEAKNI